MLSYLAAALPPHTGAAARLLAVQCALRMNSTGQVRLPTGVLRSLRLGRGQEPWCELEQAGWLCRVSAVGAVGSVVVARILDSALFTQSPARPDRMSAADWALRAASGGRAGVHGPLPQVIALCLAAYTRQQIDHGRVEVDRMARDCGLVPTAFFRRSTSWRWLASSDSGVRPRTPRISIGGW
ncbi:hypothetical protein B1H18_03190 [Streptomyces tsukubensis]|uniref:Uncharacterized protein n=1 Tax=Streptomyces tsukubensis TaxID=83656 RepID=A0A1V4AEV5_9ACTN|nr:hypothetical protein B1H18_03190 [Streptomyces tsukubensis]